MKEGFILKRDYGKGYVYIYNPYQKDFYINESCPLIDSDIHNTTKKTFWIFKYDDVQQAYKLWMNRKYGNRQF